MHTHMMMTTILKTMPKLTTHMMKKSMKTHTQATTQVVIGTMKAWKHMSPNNVKEDGVLQTPSKLANWRRWLILSNLSENIAHKTQSFAQELYRTIPP